MLRRRSDNGFTLIELVVTVSIVGIVMVSLVGIVFGYLRLSNETRTRLDESTDQQFVTAYWQQDVSSVGLHTQPVSASIPSAQSVWVGSAPGCTPTSPGAPIVMFSWNDYKAVPTADPTLTWTNASQNFATYYTKSVTNPNGTAQIQLWRKRCGDTTSDIVVARNLIAAPTVACYGSDGNTPLGSCTSPSPLPLAFALTLAVQDKSDAVHGGSDTTCPAGITVTGTGYCTTLTAETRQR